MDKTSALSHQGTGSKALDALLPFLEANLLFKVYGERKVFECISAVNMATVKNDALKKLIHSPKLFIEPIVTSLANGLPMDGVLASLVPYKGKPTFVAGYKGLELLYQTALTKSAVRAGTKPETALLLPWHMTNKYYQEVWKQQDNRGNPCAAMDDLRITFPRKAANYAAFGDTNTEIIVLLVLHDGKVYATYIEDRNSLMSTTSSELRTKLSNKDPNTYTPWKTHSYQMLYKTLIKRYMSHAPFCMLGGKCSLENRVEDYSEEDKEKISIDTNAATVNHVETTNGTSPKRLYTLF